MEIRTPVDRKYAPVPTNAESRTKSATRPDMVTGPGVDEGSVGDPDANL